MFFKKGEIIEQARRIAELEEILCPCQQHDFIEVDSYLSGGSGLGDERTVYRYICRRCKKQIQTTTKIYTF